MHKVIGLVHITVSSCRCQVLVSRKSRERLLSVLALGVVFFDDLLAYHTAADLRASALLYALGLLGVARGRRLPNHLISGGPCAADGRSTLRGLSRAFPMLGICGRTVVRRIVVCVVGLRLFALAVHMLAAGARVSTVATFWGSQGFQAEVATDTILVVRGDVLVVVEARGVSYVVLRLRDFYASFALVYAGDIHRDQGGLEAEEPHLDADVFFAVCLVHEEVVDFADPLPLIVVNLVVLVLLLELPQPIFARHVLLLDKLAAVCDLVTRVRAAGKHVRSWRMMRGSGLLNYREGRSFREVGAWYTGNLRTLGFSLWTLVPLR